MAVNTPAITANAHPAVITIQPPLSAFDRLSSTAATTPSPNKIKIIVPRNSPSHGEVIDRGLLLRVGEEKAFARNPSSSRKRPHRSPRSLVAAVFLSNCSRFHPIERARHGLLPSLIKPFALRFRKAR